MCGLFSMMIFLMLPSYILILIQIPFAAAATVVASGKTNLIRKSISFLLVTYLLGGITMAVFLFTKNNCIYTPAAIYSGDMKAGMLAVSVSICAAASRRAVYMIRNIKFEGTYMAEAVIISGEIHINVSAFIDTGNNLTDPMSGQPVCIASNKLWREMEYKGMIRPDRIRLVPYESIGGKGMLQAVRIDEISVDNASWGKCIIARNDYSFNFGQNRHADLLIWEGREKC